MAPVGVGEGDAEAVVAEGPVQGVRGRGAEVVQEGDVCGEGGEERGRDGGEADIFEGAVGWDRRVSLFFFLVFCMFCFV